MRWLAAYTVKLDALADAVVVRSALDLLKLKADQKTPAAPATVARKRAVFSGALKYGVELKHLASHPMSDVSWTAPAVAEEIDRRVVVNPPQARRLLGAVREIAPELEAFFGSMYYAALRPEEALHLANEEYERPRLAGAWGWLHLTGATVTVGKDWGDADSTQEERGLKHRSAKATRSVPVCPELVALLDAHVETYGVAPNGRLFVTRRGPGGRYVPTAGQPIPNNTYTSVWRRVRQAVLTTVEQRSPLAKVPYHLRHAAVSLWLNAGVSAPQVAEWAGHSVNVLMRVYAKCIYGQEAAARLRIEAALAQQWGPGERSGE
ncbi:integrase [Hamadaea flava]|uniref:Tyrosine-type recombinase/integrase n=1 Tax=Hamadaea flava TaxID=1742688 RepID=A0ABV8LI66_9ACTN|nr:hypothetical protein [Hamadaea flava]MCP2325662.1 integrase [Hamadaea flava]